MGFKLPGEVKTAVSRLAANFKEALLNGERALIPYYLFLLWESLEQDNSIISKSELMEYLDSLYDRDSGVYNTIALSEMPTSVDEMPEYGPRPEMYQTYYAMQLLSDIKENIPDKDTAFNFVLSSKIRFGFSRAPDWPDPNLEALPLFP